jgi:hypothetical protein
VIPELKSLAEEEPRELSIHDSFVAREEHVIADIKDDTDDIELDWLDRQAMNSTERCSRRASCFEGTTSLRMRWTHSLVVGEMVIEA